MWREVIMKNSIILKHIGLLDKIKTQRGNEALKNVFYESYKKNKKEAISLINREILQFASLFILRDGIRKYDLFNDLTLKNKIALTFTEAFLNEKIIPKDLDPELFHPVLKWIIQTGRFDDGLSKDYDRVLDLAAILLIKNYNDKEILPLLVDIIFERNRKRLLIHDMVWAFFESRSPNSLQMIGNYILSKEPMDFELALKLLKFIPCIDIKSNKSNEELYLSFLDWFEENKSFLYFTGEGFQQSCNPIPYVVLLEAKYLCKPVAIEEGKILSTLTKKEMKLLENFKKLDNETKLFLSSSSYKLHQRDMRSWYVWLSYPINQQIKNTMFV